MKGSKLALIIAALFILLPRAYAQQNLECNSGEAQQILTQMLRNRFAPPAIKSLEALARGSQVSYSVQLGKIDTLDSKPLYRQCFAEAVINTNGHVQQVHVRYSLFVSDNNRILVRTDEITR